MMVEQKMQGLDPAAVQSYYASVKKSELVKITVEMLMDYEKQKYENAKLKQAVEEGNEKLATMHELYNELRHEHADALRAYNQAQRDYAAAIKYQEELQACCAEREKAVSEIIFLFDDFIYVYQHYVSVDVQDSFAKLFNAIIAKEKKIYGTKQRGTITCARSVASL